MFNYNYPNSYTPWYQQQAQQSNGINWCQGIAGAKSYPVAPGQSVMLMDSEGDVFYIKSADASGVPQPLRIFDFKERKPESDQSGNYVTRDELEKRLQEMMNGKQSLSANGEQ